MRWTRTELRERLLTLVFERAVEPQYVVSELLEYLDDADLLRFMEINELLDYDPAE